MDRRVPVYHLVRRLDCDTSSGESVMGSCTIAFDSDPGVMFYVILPIPIVHT